MVFCCAAQAEPVELRIDAAASTISLSLAARLHTVHGSAKLVATPTDTIRFDPQTGAASGRIVVDAASTETGIGARDRKMHDDVLEVGKFPRIVFLPMRIEGAPPVGGGKVPLKVVGTLEVHGESHADVTVPMLVSIQGDSLSAIGTFTVPYVDWGMQDPSNALLRVAKEVHVGVHIVGTLAGSPGQ